MTWKTQDDQRKTIAYISYVSGEIYFPDRDGTYTKIDSCCTVTNGCMIEVTNAGAYTPVRVGDTLSLVVEER